jgi:hypothetical protein
MRDEQIEPRRDVALVAAQHRCAAGPLIAGQLQPSRRVEPRIDEVQQTLDGLGPRAPERGVALDDPGADAEQASDVVVAAGPIERPRGGPRQRGVAEIDATLGGDDALGAGPGLRDPRRRRGVRHRRAGLARQRRPLGSGVREQGQPQRLLDRVLQGRRRLHGFGRRRQDVGDEGDVEVGLAAGGPQAGDHLVEQRQRLPHFIGAIAVVLARPLGQLAAGPFGEGQLRGPPGSDGDVAERPGDDRAHHGEVGLAAGGGIVGRAHGLRIALGARPVHLRRRHRRHRQAIAQPDGHDHAIAGPGELADRGHRRSIPQEQPICGRRRGCRRRPVSDERDAGRRHDCERQQPAAEAVRDGDEPRMWKTCGQLVEHLCRRRGQREKIGARRQSIRWFRRCGRTSILCSLDRRRAIARIPLRQHGVRSP